MAHIDGDAGNAISRDPLRKLTLQRRPIEKLFLAAPQGMPTMRRKRRGTTCYLTYVEDTATGTVWVVLV